MIEKRTKVNLTADEIPRKWYNILPDLPPGYPPPLDPKTFKPPPAPELMGLLSRLFPKECLAQAASLQIEIDIPEDVLEAYLAIGRPTPLQRATRLEKNLGTPARIYFKREDVNPVGSHKPNTAIPQAYYNMQEGIERITTETGAGQWGSALALACALFKIDCTVYMTRSSYLTKPGRKTIMETFGAEVFPSPSENTEFGKKLLKKDKNHPGSLGIAISEAVEDCMKHEKTKYSLGSVLDFVLLHQTIIGLEAKAQMESLDAYPDIVVGCIGGGSNYAGLSYPFIRDKLKKNMDTRFIAVEPTAVPSTTKGVYAFDYGDTAEIAPVVKMYTVGHTFQCPPIHAAGLRYHGKAPSMCFLINKGVMESRAYNQNEVMAAADLFAKTEGFIAAPETAHAIKAVVDLALEAKKTGEEKTILFNYSGHGLLDLKVYEEYYAKTLKDFSATEEMLDAGLRALPKVLA
ncbi:MAG: TrpB-like pyridoxal phosphate-dependent enzyme [Candidatus Bathyarchaeia archaeon]